MIYRNFKDLKLSSLGLGCMRLPVIDGNDAKIDEEAAMAMIDEAYRSGVNYFDTAWGYHGGNSEALAGKALSRYPRESFYVATKFPGYDIENIPHIREIFPRQLERLGMDYVDFYLFHNVYEKNVDMYTDPKYGILEYLIEQKRLGKIRHLGFSCHGSIDVLKKFLAAAGEYMEFCQIQLNYMDWHLQKAEQVVKILNEAGLPIWVMEPLRGGKLARVSEQDAAMMRSFRPDENPVAWGFRFIQSLPGVVMTLSGMSNMDQIKSNIATFSEEKPLTKEEFDALVAMADRNVKSWAVPCTTCRYCKDYCPQGLNIPYLLNLYNQRCITGPEDFIASMAVDALPEDKRPSACLGCGACAEVCPQKIAIPSILADFAEKLK